MTRLPILQLSIVAVLILTIQACELQTQDPESPIMKPANTLVINEVFTLPPTNQSPFSWIEFYNPRKDSIDLDGWTFSFTTRGAVVKFALDSAGQPVVSSAVVLQSGEGVYDVPLPPLTLRSSEFLTVTNNEARMLNFTNYGPGNGFKIVRSANIQQFIILVNPDTTKPDTGISYQVSFQFRTTDQLVLKNPQGQVVDVVRYGNYVYGGPGSDPFPANRSTGVMPEYQSIARFNGAYFTGNTAEDFYITGTQIPLTRPIPHWHSQAYKQ